MDTETQAARRRVGDRLRTERTRLGLSQPRFGEIADAAKRTVIDWEKGVSSPTAMQLSVLLEAGVDALYVLTGTHADAADPKRSARLKLLRKRLGKNQSRMAGALQLSLRGYQNYERGERKLPAARIDRAREHLGVNPRWLWDGVGEMFLRDADGGTSDAPGRLRPDVFRQRLGSLIGDVRFHKWLIGALESALARPLTTQEHARLLLVHQGANDERTSDLQGSHSTECAR